MAHSHRPKQPLDVLQSMINGILIEVGRALRSSDKEGGRTLANSNTRLRSFFPGAIDNFQQALDELETDIARAKAVFIRDLEDLQARRHALENPPVEAVEDTIAQNAMPAEDPQENITMEDREPTPQSAIKEEESILQEPAPEPIEDAKPIDAVDPPNDTIPKAPESSKGLSGPSPPSFLNDTITKSNSIGLGMDITASTEDPVLAMSGISDTSIDSLFDMVDNGENNGSGMNFDSLEFLDTSNTQSQNEFDLSTFGNTEEANLDIQTLLDVGGNVLSKQGDIFDDILNTSGGGDMMDLDMDLGTAGGDASVFDDIYFGDGDGGNMGGEMEHGDIDSDFFGLE